MFPFRALARSRPSFSATIAGIEHGQRALLSTDEFKDELVEHFSQQGVDRTPRINRESRNTRAHDRSSQDNSFGYSARATNFHRDRGLGHATANSTRTQHDPRANRVRHPTDDIPSIGYDSNRFTNDDIGQSGDDGFQTFQPRRHDSADLDGSGGPRRGGREAPAFESRDAAPTGSRAKYGSYSGEARRSSPAVDGRESNARGRTGQSYGYGRPEARQSYGYGRSDARVGYPRDDQQSYSRGNRTSGYDRRSNSGDKFLTPSYRSGGHDRQQYRGGYDGGDESRGRPQRSPEADAFIPRGGRYQRSREADAFIARGRSDDSSASFRDSNGVEFEDGVEPRWAPRRAAARRTPIEHLPLEGNVVEMSKDKAGAQRLCAALENDVEDNDEAQMIVGEILDDGGPRALRQLMENRRAYTVMRAIVMHGSSEGKSKVCKAMLGNMVPLCKDRSAFFVVQAMLVHYNKNDGLKDQLVAEIFEDNDAFMQICTTRNGHYVIDTLLQTQDGTPVFADYCAAATGALIANLSELLVDEFGHRLILTALDSNLKQVSDPLLKELLATSPFGATAYPLFRLSDDEYANNVLCKVLEVGSEEEKTKLRAILEAADEISNEPPPIVIHDNQASEELKPLETKKKPRHADSAALEPRTSREDAEAISHIFTSDPEGIEQVAADPRFATRRRASNSFITSSEVEQKFVQGSLDERAYIARQLSGNVLLLSTIRGGAFIVRAVLEHGSPDQRAAVADEVKEHIVALSTHLSGRFVVEAALDATTPHQRAELLSALIDEDERVDNGDGRRENGDEEEGDVMEGDNKGNKEEGDEEDNEQEVIERRQGFARLADHEHGSFVVRSIIEHGNPKELKQIATALRGSFTELALDKYGHFVVDGLLKSAGFAAAGMGAGKGQGSKPSAAVKIRDLVADELLADEGDNYLLCATDANGTFTSQTLLEFGSAAQRVKVQECLMESIHELAIHKHAHFVVLKALLLLKETERNELIDALLDDDPEVIRYIADRPAGKFVLRKVMERGTPRHQELCTSALEGSGISLYDKERAPAEWMHPKQRGNDRRTPRPRSREY